MKSNGNYDNGVTCFGVKRRIRGASSTEPREPEGRAQASVRLHCLRVGLIRVGGRTPTCRESQRERSAAGGPGETTMCLR
jgi:hypothetical protein